MINLDTRLASFLCGTKGEALCIVGKWGTGKTYAWRRALLLAAKSKLVGHRKYSYLSLFGTDSLSEIKTLMFENAVNVSDIGNPAKISDVNDLLNRVSDITRRHHRFLSKLPQFIGMKTDFTFITSLFMNVRDYIICIDDLERRSASLPLSDVLGLVSFLSQERNCKVVVLLNDGELSDSDAASLKRFSEKVFDSLIRFAPEPSYGL